MENLNFLLTGYQTSWIIIGVWILILFSGFWLIKSWKNVKPMDTNLRITCTIVYSIVGGIMMAIFSILIAGLATTIIGNINPIISTSVGISFIIGIIGGIPIGISIGEVSWTINLPFAFAIIKRFIIWIIITSMSIEYLVIITLINHQTAPIEIGCSLLILGVSLGLIFRKKTHYCITFNSIR